MQWHSINEFLAMGGYAFYVWGSFGVTFLCMALEVFLIRKRNHLVQITKRQQSV